MEPLTTFEKKVQDILPLILIGIVIFLFGC